MEEKVYESVIVDNQLYLPKALIEYFAEGTDFNQWENTHIVATRGMQDRLYFFREEDWKIFVRHLNELPVKEVHARKFSRFFKASATDVEIIENKVCLGLLKKWLDEQWKLLQQEIEVVLYREEKEDYERIILSSKKDFEASNR